MAEEFGIAAGGVGGGESHARVVFSLQQDQPDKLQSVLDEEREKHRRRAERFGTSYKDPGRVRKDFSLMMEARKERMRASHGFTTGDLDVFSPEEREKRAARATRFRLEAPLAPSLDEYKPDEEMEARARRAVKFGVPYQPTDAVLMDMDLYEQRREVDKDVERRPDTIYLYGVDVMSTKEVLSYFSEYGPVFVEWLDDSSCNVVFGDSNGAKRALVGKGSPLPPEVVAMSGLEAAAAQQQQQQQQQQQEGQQQQAGPGELDLGNDAAAAAQAAQAVRYQPELPVPDNLADVANLPYIWQKGQDFVKEGASISLVYRMATVEDVRDMNQPKRTRALWRGAAGGGGGGGGRAGRGRLRGVKRPFRRGGGGGDGDGPTDMDVEGEGPGAGEGGDGDGEPDVPMKRQRGVRGGQRQVLRDVRPSLQPYGGTSLLQVGAAVLPPKGHVLDYTELEDEDPAAAAAATAGEAAAAPAPRLQGGDGGGAEGWAGGGRGWRGGRRGRGGGGGDGDRFEGDLREMLKARRRVTAAPAPPRGSQEEGEEGGYGSEGGLGGEEGGDGGRAVGEGEGNGDGAAGREEGEHGGGGGETVAEMDE
ncbi:hypothetical protein PLESTF_001030700 [Pleodorina starrii]|nr:hypothetical protein PLESTF_001030700 [Pleodorina starrii]